MTDLGHDYSPDPATGKCTECPRNGHDGHPGRCQWCAHPKARHNGNVPPEVRTHFEYQTFIHGKQVTLSRVKWATTACSVAHCACKRYES